MLFRVFTTRCSLSDGRGRGGAAHSRGSVSMRLLLQLLLRCQAPLISTVDHVVGAS
jgi:hypothetical protein